MNRVICAGIRVEFRGTESKERWYIFKQGVKGHVDSRRHMYMCTSLCVC